MKSMQRYVILLLGIGSSLFSPTQTWALTQQTAINQCQADVEALKNASCVFNDTEIASVFQKMIARLDQILETLKKTNDIKEIYLMRQSCAQGFKTTQWIVENFATESGSPHVPMHQNTSPAVPESVNKTKPIDQKENHPHAHQSNATPRNASTSSTTKSAPTKPVKARKRSKKPPKVSTKSA